MSPWTWRERAAMVAAVLVEAAVAYALWRFL